MTRLQAGCPRNYNLIPSRGNRFVSLSSNPDWLWGPLSCVYSTSTRSISLALTPTYCHGEERVELYLHSPTDLHGMDRINSTITVTSHIHLKHKLYSRMAGFSCSHQGLAFGFHSLTDILVKHYKLAGWVYRERHKDTDFLCLHFLNIFFTYVFTCLL
jgi:hypothetical protein